MLQALAEAEGEHRRLLEGFREGRRPLPEGSAQVGSLMESSGAPPFSATMSPADAFLLAANKERRAVQRYDGWASLYQVGPERELLLRLAEMERQHLARVEAMLSNAAFPEAW